MQKFHCINIKCHDIKAIESCLNAIQPPNITDISGLPSIIMQMLNKVTAYIVEYKNCDYSLLLLTDTYMSAELSQKLSANTQSTAIYTLFTEYDNAVYIFDNGKRVFEFEQHGFEPPIFYCDDTYKQDYIIIRANNIDDAWNIFWEKMGNVETGDFGNKDLYNPIYERFDRNPEKLISRTYKRKNGYMTISFEKLPDDSDYIYLGGCDNINE